MVVLDGADGRRHGAEDDGQLVVEVMSGSGCDGADAVGSGKRFHITEYRRENGFSGEWRVSALESAQESSKNL
jgi:hypothetical protein